MSWIEIEPDQALFETADYANANGGAGIVTRHTCGFCGEVRNVPPPEYAEDPDWLGDEWSYEIVINGVQVLDCCFDKIEKMFLYLAVLPNAMEWLHERLEERASEARSVAQDEEERQEVAATLVALLGNKSR